MPHPCLTLENQQLSCMVDFKKKIYTIFLSNCACMSPRVKYRKGPYLLPVRGILEKGDTVIQEEINEAIFGGCDF